VVGTAAAQSPADRAAQVSEPVSEPVAAAAPRPVAAPITVRAGDSLWSIAAAGLGPDAEVGDIDAAWRELYAANRDAIGSNPDLIRPGLDLEPGPNRKARP
jgi:nucleoid-associated protein YgaU